MPATLTGGQKMATYLYKIEGNTSDATEVSTGFWSDQTYPDGKNVAQVAFFNEYGNGRAPPRPFFRRMIALGEKHWGEDLGKLMKAANFDARVALGQMGLSLKNELQASITAQAYAPLAQRTIDAKGHDQQLVDTGLMLQSVDFKGELMDLHGAAAGAIGLVNPFIIAQVQTSTGYTTTADGVQVPAYAPVANVSVQVQALQFSDLAQLSALNIQGVRRKAYVAGHYAAVVRVGSEGGDLLTFPEYPGGPTRTWLVAFVFEQWPDWCSLALTLQNE